MKDLSIDSTFTLNNTVQMPVLGLGTFHAGSGKETIAAVHHALEAGYRHIDTASIYGNETDIGKALLESRIPREDIFITSKLWNPEHGYHNAIAACDKSLKRLGVSYLDLYLIHWPVPELRNETWGAMETLLDEGKCRAIGVSNYIVCHLEGLMDHSSRIPAVNQVEFSPYLYQKRLLEFCRNHNIQLESFSPLTQGKRLDDPKLVAVASRYSKTPAQIMIRWALQHEIAVIPKSVKKERIYENSDVFDFTLSPGDMNTLDSFHDDLRTVQDPSDVP